MTICRRNHVVDFRQGDGVCDLRADHVSSHHNTHSVCDPPSEKKRVSLSSETHLCPLTSVYLNKKVRNETWRWCVSVECFWRSITVFLHFSNFLVNVCVKCLDYLLFRRKEENPQLCRDITLLSLLKNMTTVIKTKYVKYSVLSYVLMSQTPQWHHAFSISSLTQRIIRKYLFCF